MKLDNSKFYDEKYYQEFGIMTNIEVLKNGELRARLIGDDGMSYARTESRENCYWQRAHFHQNTQETYIVISGKIVIAIKENEETKLIILEKNGVYVIAPNVSHNIYMYQNTAMHTVKTGINDGIDWNLDEKFNEVTQGIKIE